MTLYVRLEPTTDQATVFMLRDCPHLAHPTQHCDVVAYSDPLAIRLVCRWPWHYSSRPTKRNKYANFNCARYRLVWLDPLAFQRPEPSELDDLIFPNPVS